MTDEEGIYQQILSADYTILTNAAGANTFQSILEDVINEEIVNLLTDIPQSELSRVESPECYQSYENFHNAVRDYIDGDYIDTVEDNSVPTNLTIFLEGCTKSLLSINLTATILAVDATTKSLYWAHYASSSIKKASIPWLKEVSDTIDIPDEFQIIKEIHQNIGETLWEQGVYLPAMFFIFTHEGEDSDKKIKIIYKEDFLANSDVYDNTTIEIINIGKETDYDKEFKPIEETLERFYSKENYDIVKTNILQRAVTLYYPEIEITNSLNLTHTIKDLYVRVIFNYTNNSFIPLMEITGYRGKVTNFEYRNNYYHSHLSDNTGTFCLGSSELRNHMILMRGGYTQTDIEIFFILLDNYLKWESLEGVPYRSIKTIPKTFSVNKNLHSLSTTVIKQVSTKLLNNQAFMEKLIGAITLETKSINLTPNVPIESIFFAPVIIIKTLESIIDSFIESDAFAEYGDALRCYIDSSGVYYNSEGDSRLLTEGTSIKHIPYTFKGVAPDTIIYTTETELQEKPKDRQIVHPNITAYVATFIYNLIYLKWQQK